MLKLLVDITYASLAKAFSLPLKHDEETQKRMFGLSTAARREELSKATPAQQEARARMALFPTATEAGQVSSEVLYVDGTKWVPVVRLAGKVNIAS